MASWKKFLDDFFLTRSTRKRPDRVNEAFFKIEKWTILIQPLVCD